MTKYLIVAAGLIFSPLLNAMSESQVYFGTEAHYRDLNFQGKVQEQIKRRAFTGQVIAGMPIADNLLVEANVTHSKKKNRGDNKTISHAVGISVIKTIPLSDNTEFLAGAGLNASKIRLRLGPEYVAKWGAVKPRLMTGTQFWVDDHFGVRLSTTYERCVRNKNYDYKLKNIFTYGIGLLYNY